MQILAKLMISIVFNSVPVEQVHANWGCNPVLTRVKSVLQEMRNYGVTDLFQPADLTELRNVPAVTRSLAQLQKLVGVAASAATLTLNCTFLFQAAADTSNLFYQLNISN